MKPRRPETERLAAATVPFDIDRAYRIVRSEYAHEPLGCVPTPSRFADPDRRYRVLYAASSVGCAIAEALVRDSLSRRARRAIALEVLRSRHVVTLSRGALRMVDLRGRGAFRIGAPSAAVRDARHQAGNRLSASAYEDLPDVDGFAYSSRLTEEACIAVFDRALHKLDTTEVVPLIAHPDTLPELADLGVGLFR